MIKDGAGGMVEDDINGYVIGKTDPKLMAEKVLEISNNKEKLKTLSENARKYSLAHDVNKVMQQYESLIKDLITGSG